MNERVIADRMATLIIARCERPRYVRIIESSVSKTLVVSCRRWETVYYMRVK